jgi:hypothetical protein
MLNFKRAIPRGISIEPTHNGGFFVTTGCCRLCFADANSLCAGLREYLENPDLFEKQYHEMCQDVPQREGGLVDERYPADRPDEPTREAQPAPLQGRGFNHHANA